MISILTEFLIRIEVWLVSTNSLADRRHVC